MDEVRKAQVKGFEGVWPAELTKVKMSQEEVRTLQLFMRQHYPALRANGVSTTLAKDRVHYLPTGSVQRLPRTVTVFPLGEVVVFQPTSNRHAAAGAAAVVGRGATCTVKPAWELTQGVPVCKKQLDADNPIDDIYLAPEHAHRGIVPVVGTRERDGKHTLIEYRWEQDLGSYLDQKTPTVPEKLKIFRDLLEGLTSLHERNRPIALNIPGRAGIFKRNYTLAHSDLKPANIVIKHDNGVVAAGITDFGGSGQPHQMVHTPLFASPEYRTLIQQSGYLPAVDVIDRNGRDGAMHDNWAMGYVLTGVMNGIERGFIPKLPGLTPQLCNPNYVADQVTTTGAINHQIQSAGTPAERELWEVVEGLMRVDPAVRWTAARALARVKEIERRHPELAIAPAQEAPPLRLQPLIVGRGDEQRSVRAAYPGHDGITTARIGMQENCQRLRARIAGIAKPKAGFEIVMGPLLNGEQLVQARFDRKSDAQAFADKLGGAAKKIYVRDVAGGYGINLGPIRMRQLFPKDGNRVFWGVLRDLGMGIRNAGRSDAGSEVGEAKKSAKAKKKDKKSSKKAAKAEKKAAKAEKKASKKHGK